MARMFNERPSKIVDPDGIMGKIFAFEFDSFCASIALQMISEGKLI